MGKLVVFLLRIIGLIRSLGPKRSYPFREILSAAAGPTPWYVSEPAAKIACGAQQFKWKERGNISALYRGAKCVGLVPMYTYVYSIGNRFLVWDTKLILRYFDACMLEEINPDSIIVDGQRVPITFRGGRLAELAIADHTNLGFNHVAFPDVMRSDFEEIIMVFQQPLRVCILRPNKGTIEVIPQDWFNNSTQTDFGYEWVTRAARTPQGSIVCDGIRIGPVLLRELNRKDVDNGVTEVIEVEPERLSY